MFRGNFPSTMTRDQIKSCNYHPKENPFCPIFRVGDVLNYTGQKIEDLADKVKTNQSLSFGLNLKHKVNSLLMRKNMRKVLQ